MQEVYELIGKVAGDQGDGADPGRERRRQGAGRPRDPLQQRRAPTGRSSSSTARRCRRASSKASCSATRRARSPAPSPCARAASNWPTAARSSSTRSANSACRCRPSCCACCRRRRSSGSAASQPVKVDLRIIAATNRNLIEMIGEGNFPRGSVLPAQRVPDDHPAAARPRQRRHPARRPFRRPQFAPRRARRSSASPRPALNMLMAYHWPGNVRELENVIERSVILSEDGVIHGYNLPPSLQTSAETGHRFRLRPRREDRGGRI